MKRRVAVAAVALLALFSAVTLWKSGDRSELAGAGATSGAGAAGGSGAVGVSRAGAVAVSGEGATSGPGAAAAAGSGTQSGSEVAGVSGAGATSGPGAAAAAGAGMKSGSDVAGVSGAGPGYGPGRSSGMMAGSEATPPGGAGATTGGRPALSEEEKTRIRRFWEVYRRGTDLKQQGAWEQAASAYRDALQIDPLHEDALYYLGNALFELERYDEAVASWRRLVDVNPLSARAHAQLGAVYSCGAPGAPFDLDAAEKEFLRALAINKEESGPVLKLGEVSLLKGDRRRALDYFTAAARMNFKGVEAPYLIGYVRWLEGDGKEALAALQKSVKLSQADRPVKGVAGEGDTRKKAAQPILSEGASRKSLFAPHWMALKDWPDGEPTASRMDTEYRKLDSAIAELKGSPDAGLR